MAKNQIWTTFPQGLLKDVREIIRKKNHWNKIQQFIVDAVREKVEREELLTNGAPHRIAESCR